MSKKIDAALRPYGYVPGKEEGWCAACARTFPKCGPGGFKCRACAHGQAAQVEHECRAAGMEG